MTGVQTCALPIYLWGGLPITLKGGKYDLDAHVLCLRRDLRSDNLLTLKDLDLKSRHSLNGTIWGMPMKTWLKFVESEKKIKLNVKLEGEISSPSLGSGEAFNEAFQNALRQKTESGLKFFTNGAVQIADKTGSIVRETPSLLVNGVEKIVSLVPNQLAGEEVKKTGSMVLETPEFLVTGAEKIVTFVPETIVKVGNKKNESAAPNPAPAQADPAQPSAKEPV